MCRAFALPGSRATQMLYTPRRLLRAPELVEQHCKRVV